MPKGRGIRRITTVMNRLINSPKGFKAAGVHAGIKNQKKDLALVISDRPAVAAGCFTKNRVKAAPVLLDKEILTEGRAFKGIVVNSGNANACTGKQGMEDARAMGRKVAALAGCQPEEVFVCSTGVIGVMLPMEKIISGIDLAWSSLSSDEESGIAALEAIMTTDLLCKSAYEELSLNGSKVVIAGMAKGSGMIHPNMGTMLAFITTDAAISGSLLQRALSGAVEDTFNMVSIDGDTSTNDTVLALANGMADNKAIDFDDESYQAFSEALMRICRKLAIDVARDGEGASKLMEVVVEGAETMADARLIARSVASSSLFKAALFGADANWGRILCAMGYSGGAFDPDGASIALSNSEGREGLFMNGSPLAFDEEAAKRILSQKEVRVGIRLGSGAGFKATAWGCDLTYEYVRINGDYRS
ncbi:MAG: bifunctional ornithine acetyltransferase/N-acetylglutamate synthase [Clostridiales bacterium]|jgi:glutamate N-acetyltransferase/amino-acid N-acetyltransferase|nr:bifunctional ornithine acetyltransferase/N-acetylglutamate synthase [Clostridiales bacterium]